MSFADSNVSGQIRGVATFYDMLGEKAFGNYRDLLEAATLHPVMGQYLTMLRNQKEDGKGRVPDENYAREIMQLFSIGLYELNNDGTYKGGTPTETYTHEDIQGLAKVFTGWSWYAGPNLADRTNSRFGGGNANPDRDWMPMQGLCRTTTRCPRRSSWGSPSPQPPRPTPRPSLKLALDTLFNHPNVGPFIGKLLIQRLVTSSSSPAYVNRVANAFNNNGQGVRGDMKAVFAAVLLDAGGPLVRRDEQLDRQGARTRAAPLEPAACHEGHVGQGHLRGHRRHRQPGDPPRPDRCCVRPPSSTSSARATPRRAATPRRPVSWRPAIRN